MENKVPNHHKSMYLYCCWLSASRPDGLGTRLGCTYTHAPNHV